MKKVLKIWVPALLAMFMTCLFPCMFMFARNAGEAKLEDTGPFLLLFLITAAAVFLLCSVVFRNVGRAAFFSCLVMLVVINFNMAATGIKHFVPWMRGLFVLGAICIILLLIAALLLTKKPDMTAWCSVIAVTFAVLILVNLGAAIPKLLGNGEKKEILANEKPLPEISQEEQVNVYLMLFDEYGNDENLEYYFGLDNQEFYDELSARGFSISHTTKNTESCWTDTLMPNLLNLNYVADDSMTESARKNFMDQPYLYRLFEEQGYSVNIINHRAYLKTAGTHELTSGQVEDNISEYLLDNSLFCRIDYIRVRIENLMFLDYRDNYAVHVDNAFDALLTCSEYAKSGPTLTVSYIQSPHAPFIYREDGSVLPLEEGWNWHDTSLYPGQLKYVNQMIIEAVDNIQKNDPDAVIILLSDHGARVPLHLVEQFGGPRFDAKKETPKMQGVLCCAYLPGQKVEIEGKTGINALREVINAQFNADLEEVKPAKGYILDDKFNAKDDA